MERKKNVSTWLKITAYSVIGLFTISDFFSNLTEENVSSAEALGASVWTLIGGIIGIACGIKCSKWAGEIKKSPNVAYVIGFIFSLLGLLAYWIYYKAKR